MAAILGLSGLANSVDFKRNRWLGLDDREYRNCQGLDSAAAIVIDARALSRIAI
jgi:carbamoyltransferase